MTTQILLLRHTHTKTIGGEIQGDFSKPISEAGRTLQHKVDNLLKTYSILPDEIWYSPTLRCQQTAEVMGEDFELQPKPESALGELLDEMELIEIIAAAPPESTLFLVSHGPQILRFANYCLGRHSLKTMPTPSSGYLLEFRGGVTSGKAHLVRHVNSLDISLQ